MFKPLLVAAALCCATPAAFAQSAHSMPGMTPPAANEPASTKAFREAMRTMDEGMSIPYTGDADRDFVAGMIPHHQGAIDMAKVELQFGKDPQIRKLAREIVAAQEKEIRLMRNWQSKHTK